MDYENVHKTGLDGIDDLGKADVVHVFCNEAQSAELRYFQSSNRHKCTLKIHECVAKGKNSIDFQIGIFLGYSLGNDTRHTHMYIISKDRHFDAHTEYIKKDFGIRNIKRLETIRSSLLLNNGTVPKPLKDSSILNHSFSDEEISNAALISDERTDKLFTAVEAILKNKVLKDFQDSVMQIKCVVFLIITKSEQQYWSELLSHHINKIIKDSSVSADLYSLIVPHLTALLKLYNNEIPYFIPFTRSNQRLFRPASSKNNLETTKIIEILNNASTVTPAKRLEYVKKCMRTQFGGSNGIEIFNELEANIRKTILET